MMGGESKEAVGAEDGVIMVSGIGLLSTGGMENHCSTTEVKSGSPKAGYVLADMSTAG